MELKEFIPVALFIITIGGIIGTFFKAKGMDEVQQKHWEKEFANLHNIDEEQWRHINKLKEVDASHEREDWKMKSELELKISSLDGTVGKLNGKLDSIEKKLDNLITTIENRKMRHGDA